ncbi:MAG: DUF2934 domain-containing protein [Gammaproteobacteria bacterium]|jgi:uncharacterized protein HemX
MAEKPKGRSLEMRPQKTTLEKKALSAKKVEKAQHITPEERWNRIADAAYYRAEKRGFVSGDPAEDWLAAEAEIDAELAERKLSGEK